jgi:hypothetical protein
MSDTTTNPSTGTGGLGSAVGGRARISTQIAVLLRSRPPTGSDHARVAGWLRDKADVHDQIATRLREIGDVPGAVEAEVLAARARLDARDLTPTTSGLLTEVPITHTSADTAAGAGAGAGLADQPVLSAVSDEGDGLP